MSGKTEVTPNITDDPPYPKPEEEKPVKPKREYDKYEMVRFNSSLKPSNEPFLLSCFSLVEEMYGDVRIKGRGLYSLLHDVFRYFAVRKKHKYIAVTVFEQDINLEDENQVHNKFKSQLLRFTSLKNYEARDM